MCGPATVPTTFASTPRCPSASTSARRHALLVGGVGLGRRRRSSGAASPGRGAWNSPLGAAGSGSALRRALARGLRRRPRPARRPAALGLEPRRGSARPRLVRAEEVGDSGRRRRGSAGARRCARRLGLGGLGREQRLGGSPAARAEDRRRGAAHDARRVGDAAAGRADDAGDRGAGQQQDAGEEAGRARGCGCRSSPATASAPA